MVNTIKVLSKRKLPDTALTVDIEVAHNHNPTHSYQIVTGGVKPVYNGEVNSFIDNQCNPILHNSVSLLAGVTPGVHYPISTYYIRRVRLMKDSELVKPLMDSGFYIEPCKGSEKSTVVVEFPCNCGDNIKTQKEVSIWEKIRLTEFMQEYWADNQVSVTVDFDPAKEGNMIESVLNYSQYKLKSVSFLPRFDNSTPYPQMPYEEITKEKYNELIKKIKPLDFDSITIIKEKEYEVEQDMYCDSDKCYMIDKKESK